MRILFSIFILLICAGQTVAQNFDFASLDKKIKKYAVSVNIVAEVSFGTQTTEVKSRGIGTIVTTDGLVMFDGTPINSDDPFSVMSGVQISAEPKSIEIIMMDGSKYNAEYIGIDRFTRLGFCRIINEKNATFKPIKFYNRENYNLGEWLALYMLLPEFVTPMLGVDIGLVSANIVEPEEIVLTVGFNELQLASVLYDTDGHAVGVLGNLENPALSGFNASAMMESFSQMNDYLPLLGIIDADRLNKLIKDPPRLGEVNRGWLGIYLQALTDDIAEFWKIKSGGIIINDVVRHSPADSVGLKTGDIIYTLSGLPIMVNKEENLPVFQKKISEMGAGSSVAMGILRRQNNAVDTFNVNITLAQAPIPPAEAPDYEDKNFEIKIRDMVFADYNLYNLERDDFRAVVIKEVEPGGWASVGGLLPGDFIQKIDGQKIESVEDGQKMLEKIAEEKPSEIVFFVWRDNKTLFINIKTEW